jgi:hypothetical protein
LKPWLSSVGLPKFAEVKTLVHVRPLRSWFAPSLVSRPASGDCAGFIKPATHADVETAKCPEPLCPTSVLPRLGRCGPSPPWALPHGHCSYGLMRPSPCLSCPLVYGLVSGVSAGCHSAPAANGMFPMLSPLIFPQMPGSQPRRSHRVHLPVSSPMSSAFPRPLLGRLPACSTNAIFCSEVSRLANISYVQASEFARLPDRSYRCNTAAGQLRLLLPGKTCFVTSARTGYAIRPNTGN